MSTPPRIVRNRLLAPSWQPGVSLLDIAFHGEPFKKHSHAGFAIGAIESGVGGYRARGARQLFPFGTLSLLNPEEPHNGFALAPGVSYKMLYVDEAAMKRLLNHKRRHGFVGDLPRDPRGEVRQRLRWLSHLLTTPDATQALAFDEALTETLHGVMSRFARERHATQGRESYAVKSTRRYIDALIFACRSPNFEENTTPVTLDTLARRVSLHPHYLLDVYRQQTGIPPVRYWRQRRIEVALEGLRFGESISDVAIRYGFYDQAHFTRAFKTFYGVTPGCVI